MTILNINGTDFSGNVEVGSYKVNTNDVFSSWTDANGANHRQITRQQISGSFKMGFRSMEDYSEFINKAFTTRDSEGWVPCYLYVNNLNTSKSCKMYISFTPELGKNGTRNFVKMFDVTVQEK